MLDPNRFVRERRQLWKALEGELEAAANRDFETFDVERAQKLGRLYRAASADLLRARSETANEALIDYLNGLVGRAYGLIYRGRKLRWASATQFLFFDFPRLIRRRAWVIVAAASIMLAGFIFGVGAEYLDSTARFSLLPPQYASVEEQIEDHKIRAASGQIVDPAIAANESAKIMTNNIEVSFKAFAFGFTAGIGTTLVLFYNGVLVGVLAAIFLRHGMSLYFWALILPHGVIELFAIFVAGAAGFVIAQALVNPGIYGLKESLRREGKDAVLMVLGCVPMLVVAGLIEGFITPQMAIPPGIKLLFALMTGLALVAWLGFNELIFQALGVPIPPDELAQPHGNLDSARTSQ